MTDLATPDLTARLFRGWRGYVLIALIALAAGLPGLARLPVMDRDEARFAQASRQMLESGDFVRIAVQDQPRYKKPIGIHWLQAAAVAASEPISGRRNAIWAYRLPSLAGAVVAALATLWAGTALIGRGPALIGAGLFAACVLAGFEAMTAKTDAALCGLVTLAMAALARLYMGDAHPRRTALVFWAAMGGAILVKGPIGPLAAGLALVTLWLWERRAAWMRPLAHWPGPLLALAIVAPWMIAIGEATQGSFFVKAVCEDLAPKISRSLTLSLCGAAAAPPGLGVEGHGGPPGFHLALLVFLLFPATLGLPAAVRLAMRARSAQAEGAGLRFLIAWAAPIFLLFEVIPTKLPHYVLPAYPALALLGAAGLATSAREGWRATGALGVVLFAIGAAGLIAVIAFGETFMPGDASADMRRAVQGTILGAAVALAAVVAMALARRFEARAFAGMLAALALAFMLREQVLPEARELLVSSEASSALAREQLMPSDRRRLWVAGYRETSLVFETRTDVHLVDAQGLGAGARPGDAAIIEARVLEAANAALSARGLAFLARGAPVAGRNYGNGDDVRLFVGEIATAAPLSATSP